MKYVMLEYKLKNSLDTAVKIPIIFPNHLVHDDVAQALLKGISDFENKDVKVTSAGEILIDTISCHGFSETLGLGSNIEDRFIIKSIDYGGGYGPSTPPTFIKKD